MITQFGLRISEHFGHRYRPTLVVFCCCFFLHTAIGPINRTGLMLITNISFHPFVSGGEADWSRGICLVMRQWEWCSAGLWGRKEAVVKLVVFFSQDIKKVVEWIWSVISLNISNWPLQQYWHPHFHVAAFLISSNATNSQLDLRRHGMFGF